MKMKMTKGSVDFSRSHRGRKSYGSAWSAHKALLFYIVTNDYYSSKNTLYNFTKLILRDVPVKLQACPVYVFAECCSKVVT